MPRRPLELCRRELRLLVGPPKPDRSKGRGPTRRDPPVFQVRGLGTGLTTLSRKTPMLQRQHKKPPYVPHGIMGMSKCMEKMHTDVSMYRVKYRLTFRRLGIKQ